MKCPEKLYILSEIAFLKPVRIKDEIITADIPIEIVIKDTFLIKVENLFDFSVHRLCIFDKAKTKYKLVEYLKLTYFFSVSVF